VSMSTVTQGSRLYDLLADGVVRAMTGTDDGHCARVDYLSAEEAEAVCRSLRARSAEFTSYVLGEGADQSGANADLYCTTDVAVEMRNRKRGRLCLFVPIGLVDATISSLGNSFAGIDGRTLYGDAEQHILRELAPSTRATVDAIKRQLRGTARTSQGARLDFILAAERHQHAGTLDTLGLELWRVGLIANAGPDFEQRLSLNKECAGLIARPARLSASYRDRIADLKVDSATAHMLEAFFARRSLQDIRAWSHALTEGDQKSAFNHWFFPKQVESDLTAVRIDPFTSNGKLLRGSKFIPLAEPGESLRAECGDRKTLTIRWETDPPKAREVQGWRISIVPAMEDEADDEDTTLSLPSRQAKGTARSVALKLNVAKEDRPSFAVCARVVALDATGAELQGSNAQPFADKSEEFYLVEEGDGPLEVAKARRKSAATLGLARLLIAREGNESTLVLERPAWSDGDDASLFSMHADNAKKTQVQIGTSPFLLALQRRVLAEPHTGGRFTLTCDEVVPATADQIVADPIAAREGIWGDFWKTRKTFFGRLTGAGVLDALEATDWTREITNAAVKYAQAYAALLDGLVADVSLEGRAALHAALSVDTLHLTIQAASDEAAIVLLPTHPLRVAWFAGHGALLRHWEGETLARPGTQRRQAFDPALLSELRPTNVPAFAFSSVAGAEPFVFFQNLHFFYGVALPAHARDPHRRYLDVASIMGAHAEGMGDQRPDRLTDHLRDFRTIHPYADPLTVVLVNPDHGGFFAQAIEPLLQSPAGGSDDSDVEPPIPAFTITAFVMDEASADLNDLQRLRLLQEQRAHRPTDYLQPGLSTTVRSIDALQIDALQIDALQREGMPDAHIAVLSDVSRSSIRAYPELAEEAGSGSISLYGLIVRFVSSLHAGKDGPTWRYHINVPPLGKTPSKADEHPEEARLGSTLIGLHRAVLAASGCLLSPGAAAPAFPCLEVTIDSGTIDLLEEVHTHADWVVTVDRFFGIDYYDSPHDATLSRLARKYLIDYTPEFLDGLGHRSIVTTAWRDEVSMILRRAMTELGFAAVETSVRQLLHYLKTVSGRLALEAMGHNSSGTAAVSLAAVTAWLQKRGRLAHGFLVPVDAHRNLFWADTTGVIEEGERRCDLALFTLKRGIVDVSFIEVKWRRGPLTDTTELAQDMAVQMRASAAVMEGRFFNPGRIDGALQRAYLATVLRFYCDRARRYDLLAPGVADQCHVYLRQLEREGLSFRARQEGFIVSLESRQRPPMDLDSDTTITLLTAVDFEAALTMADASAVVSHPSVDAGRTHVVPTARENVDAHEHRERTENQAVSPPEVLSKGDAALAAALQPPTPPMSPLEIVLGAASGRDVIWQPSIKGSPHLFITGIPGQGKSWTTTRLLVELSRQGVPALVFDFHGQMGALDSPYVLSARPQVIDAAAGLPFSPFECDSSGAMTGWEATASAVADIFAYICNMGDMQHDALYTTIRDAYRAQGFGAESANDEPLHYPTLQEVLRRLERAQTQRGIQNIVARARPLLEMNLFRPPADGRSDLMASIRDGLVIDLHGLHSETQQNAAGAFILRKLYTDMFSWGMADRIRLALVLDEAHRLARDVTLPKIMKEGRKFGILVVVASQGLHDFHQDVLGNAGTKIAFRANYPEARKIAGFFQPQHGQELSGILANLRVGSALVQTPEMRTALQVRMAPLEDPAASGLVSE